MLASLAHLFSGFLELARVRKGHDKESAEKGCWL